MAELGFSERQLLAESGHGPRPTVREGGNVRYRPKADIRLSACSGPCSARLFIGLLAGAGALYDQAASGGESNIRCAVDKSYNRTQGSGY